MESNGGEITALLHRWSRGDPEAFQALVPIVYNELRRLANHYLQNERSGHTLQSTALVHEAFLRLVGNNGMQQWHGRAHFFAAAAQSMRRILVDHARQRQARKRGSGAQRVPLEEALTVPVQSNLDVAALDESLSNLALIDPRKSRVVELRFFGGLSNQEIAEVLGISPAAVRNDWVVAKAWLYRDLQPTEAEP
jgi:RNA polymerase sigma factor (TIGR02999 family)